ncbi:cytochrome c-type biogenesis protein CcmE [Pseudoduganella flava]|uniref:Cytochrome c-type biogenesis protein CcmE n=1 Tax=Pseudoduganella flava TaxID=871742 RepID=A0A562PP60_9BURK|nr:cytochrome c maturation protein CcmE [Pseudoduganella flava]QGZ40660.1 cytochrome c maturation protein CcmE [Pseudoduganella flava]TWI46113.1 cytochrome c-type biogenesis protein CcmE [Pseudoduganella flava]
MKPRHQRLALIGGALAMLGLGAWFVLSAFQSNLVFFFTPTQVSRGEAPRAGVFRVGGMVEKGSVRRAADGVTVSFVVTDLQRSVPVRYRGALPDLFKEGKGVVAQGELAPGNVFVAREVLAKHDENYMPPEAAYALAQKNKEQGDAAGAR